MQADPMEEWRNLTALYSEMGDVEIRELAGQINDLTDTAQQVLRDELKKRGIAERSTQNVRTLESDSVGVHWDGREETDQDVGAEASEGAPEYTWKTGLCRCDSIEEAAQRCEMLRRAGIESWVQRPGARFFVAWIDELGVGDIQINVAADQLDQARAVIANPIPQDIIDEIKQEDSSPPYEIPTCPKCGAEDPTLESADPSNSWLCESCGYTWSDPLDLPANQTQRIEK
jgi:hypothetical protein